MSNVVSLSEVRPLRSGVVCEDLGLRFPTLYRVTCDPARLGDPAARELAGPKGFLTYTLGSPLKNILKPLREGCVSLPITRLAPGLDRKSVVVRHHAHAAHAATYTDSMTDAGLPEGAVDTVYLDDEVYTILTADIPPVGQPAYTLSYMTALPGEGGVGDDFIWEHFVPPLAV